jgi:hypothetical protein
MNLSEHESQNSNAKLPASNKFFQNITSIIDLFHHAKGTRHYIFVMAFFIPIVWSACLRLILWGDIATFELLLSKILELGGAAAAVIGAAKATSRLER